MAFLGREVKNQLLSGENTTKYYFWGINGTKREKEIVEVAGCRSRLIFFAFMAILPFAWEDGDDVPAPNPTIEN